MKTMSIPALTISYDEYMNATPTEYGTSRITLDGHDDFVIVHDQEMEDTIGSAQLYTIPVTYYTFEIPTKEHPLFVVRDYYDRIPVKSEISPTCTVFGRMFGKYVPNNEISAKEFFTYYSEYYPQASYYRAYITNGQVTRLELAYTEW